MRILVIPDVHLKTKIFDMADKVDTSKYDNIVCLGDLVDEWGQQNNQTAYEDTLERVLDFDKHHPNMLWCWGNHDLSYAWCFTESGFSYRMIPVVGNYLVKMEKQFGNRFKVIHKIDDTLFSHGGLSNEYVHHIYKRVPDIEQIIKKINYMPNEKTHAKKLWVDMSPIWLRPPYAGETVTLPYLYKQDCNAFGIQTDNPLWQVVGHTPVKQPTETCGMLILDTFSLYSNLEPIGDQRLVIADTISHTWQYADI